MSLNLTYGSFGDAITTVQLVNRLVQALSASRGSAREFQDLVVELRLYQNVLQQLIFFWESKKQCAELNELANIVRPAILDSKDSINTFLESAVKRYGSSLLRQVGSRKTIWDVVKMIQWNISAKEDVEKLRDQLSQSKAAIQMIQVQAQTLANEADTAALSERIALLVTAEREVESKIDSHFAEVMDNLEKSTKTISRIEEVSNAVLSTVSSISSNVLAIRNAAHSIEQGVLMLNGVMSRLSLYNHNVVYVEDALGWTLPVILDAHPSWETIHSILLDQFARHASPGFNFVRLKKYAIQDSRTGKDAKLTIPFHQIARPGQKFNMSMLFTGDWNTLDEKLKARCESKCLSCGHINMVNNSDLDVECQNPRCQLIYRIVIDVSDADEGHLDEWVRHKRQLRVHNHDEGENDGKHCDEKEDIEAAVRKGLPLSTTLVDGPEIFKRVKFLSRWEDRIESRGRVHATLGHLCLWNISFLDGVTEKAYFQMAVSIWIHFKLSEDRIIAGLLPEEKRVHVHIWTGFAGGSREQSIPVLICATDSERVRRRLYRVIKRIDWLGPGSRFLVLTAPPSAILTKWQIEQDKRLANSPESFSYRARKEGCRRLEVLGIAVPTNE